MTAAKRIAVSLLTALSWPGSGPALAADTCADCISQTPPAAAVREAATVVQPVVRLLVDKPFTCPGYTIERNRASLRQYEPPSETISGFELPRTKEMLYRGVEAANPQLEPASAISAMLGSDADPLGSFMYSELRNILLGRKTVEQSPLAAEILGNQLVPFLDKLRGCGRMKPAEASAYAMDLLDKSFRLSDERRQTVPRLVNEGASEFNQFPRDAFYSTVYPMVAGWYGGRTVFYQEEKPRSLDHSYWMKRNAERPLESTHHLDNGQVLTPGYVLPQDLQGFWLKSSERRAVAESGRPGVAQGYSAPIAFAFHKLTVGRESFVAVLDGEDRHNCITKGTDGRFYACDLNYPNPTQAGLKAPPVIDTSRPIKAIGVIRLCKDRNPCPAPRGVIDQLGGRSSRQLPDELKAALRRVGTGDGLGALFTGEGREPALKAERPEIVRAQAGASAPAVVAPGNVTDKAAGYCNGRATCGYKVSARFLGDPSPGQPKSFKMKWRCQGEAALREISLTSAEAEGKVLDLKCTEAKPIEITEATFGFLGPVTGPKDLTADVAAFCAKETHCTYSTRGLPGGELPGPLKIEFRCPSTGATLHQAVTTGEAFEIRCP